MATSPPENKSISLSDEEYMNLANAAAEEILKLVGQKDKWVPTSHSDELCQIFTRPSIVKGATESMLMLETTIDCPSEKLFKLLAPWFEYRMKWDELLEDVSIISSLPTEIYLIRHLIRKRITLSARESIDAVKVLRKDNKVVFGATGTTHAGFPPSKSYVRTHQYIGGYVLDSISPNVTRVFAILHADLNIPGPKLFSSFADKFKPKLMLENIRALREASRKYNC